MAKHGFLIESNIMAKDVDSLNRFAVAEIDVDGGGLVALSAPEETGSDVWKAVAPTTGSLGGLWMAYNPSPRYLKTDGDLVFAGLSTDIRHYTNGAGQTFTVFKPKLGDEIVIPVSSVTTGTSAVKGDFIEAVNGTVQMSRVEKSTGATEGSTAFEVERIDKIPFPQAGIGEEYVSVIRAVCVQE